MFYYWNIVYGTLTARIWFARSLHDFYFSITDITAALIIRPPHTLIISGQSSAIATKFLAHLW
jgi:hypothetical protein